MIRPEYQAALDAIDARLMELSRWPGDTTNSSAWRIWRRLMRGYLKGKVRLLEGVE